MIWPWAFRRTLAERDQKIAELGQKLNEYAQTIADEKVRRIASYEGWMEEQKRAILEFADRLKMMESEARFYRDREETSEELRRLIVEFAHRTAEEQVTWKDIKKVEVWANTLVARIALAAKEAS